MENYLIDLPSDVVLFSLIIVLASTILVSLWSWRVIVPVMLIVGIVEVHLGFNPTFLLYGYNVLPIDVLTLGVIAAYVVRILMIGRIGLTHLCWLGLGILMMLALLRGSGVNGLATATVSFRHEFYFIATALYMQSFRWEGRDLDHFVMIWLCAAGALAVYAIFCWIDPSFVLTQGVGSLSSYFARDAYLGLRVLPASSTLLIAEAGLIAAILWLRPDRAGIMHLAAIPLLLIMVALYHRSIWVSSMAAIGILVLHRPALLSRLSLPLVAAGIGLVAIMAMGGDATTGALRSAVAEPFRDNSTWGWRVNNWQNMVPETLAAGPVTTLVGWGYGARFQDVMTGMDLANPHNAYVSIFSNTGLLGLVLFLTCLLLPFWRLWHGEFPASRTFDRHTALMLSSLLIIYYLAYSVSFDHGILLGVLAGLGAQCTARSQSDQRDMPRPALAGVA